MRHRSNDDLRHDGKNYRKMIHGRSFKVSKKHGDAEARRRFDLIESIFRDLQRQGKNDWTKEGLDLADSIRHGGSLIDFEPSFTDEGLEHLVQMVKAVFHEDGTLKSNATQKLDEVCELGKDIKVNKEISEFIENFPSLEFTNENEYVEDYLGELETNLNTILQKINTVKKSKKEAFVQTSGTLYQALLRYEKEREKPFTTGDKLNQTGHYVKGIIQRLKRTIPDFPLSRLSFSKCQEIIDRYRFRELDLSKESDTKTIQEFVRFLKWLKRTDYFDWRIDNLDELEKKVIDKKRDRIAFETIRIITFGKEEIHHLIEQATETQLTMILLALNCGYGAAESGRLRIENISFDQEHPEANKNPDLKAFGRRTWIRMLRPKSNVWNAQLLWPETAEIIRSMGVTSGEILVTATGKPLYRDYSKNSQSSFGNYFSRLVKATGVSKLSFGKLRKHFATWLRDQGEAELASMAVQHGSPVKDKLLHHYSNLPYKRYFQKQLEYREFLEIETAVLARKRSQLITSKQ